MTQTFNVLNLPVQVPAVLFNREEDKVVIGTIYLQIVRDANDEVHHVNLHPQVHINDKWGQLGLTEINVSSSFKDREVRRLLDVTTRKEELPDDPDSTHLVPQVNVGTVRLAENGELGRLGIRVPTNGRIWLWEVTRDDLPQLREAMPSLEPLQRLADPVWFGNTEETGRWVLTRNLESGRLELFTLLPINGRLEEYLHSANHWRVQGSWAENAGFPGDCQELLARLQAN